MSQDYDVFISHSSKDFEKADALRAALEAKGIKCWIAPRDVTPGIDYGRCIMQGIKAAPAMVLVFSAHADDSNPVAKEVERANNYKKLVVPLRIENIEPDNLEYYLATNHRIDAIGEPFEGHLSRVVDELLRTLDLKPKTPVTPLAQPSPPAAEIVELVSDEEQDRALEPPKPVQAGRVPFESVWQAFEQKVKSNRKWLLPGLGSSQYRVSFTPKGNPRGENVSGAGTIYSAPKRTVEQVWVEIGQGVDVTNSVVRDIIGKSAHTGFIGSIVEELRRLEATLQPDAAGFDDKAAASHEIYISHSSKDFAKADALCQALESQGVKCWIAPRDIPSGMDFAASIAVAIQAAPAMVLIFSSSADNSEHVATEVDLAMDAKAIILPVRIENVQPKMLSYRLRRRQWVDAYNGAFETQAADVARQIAHTLKPQSPVTSSTPTAPAPPVPSTFDRVWKMFADEVQGDVDWLLPGVNKGQFHVAMGSQDEVRGGIVGFHSEENLPLGTSRAVVQSVWVNLQADVKATQPAVTEVLGQAQAQGAPVSFIGAIVEELRRLEATPPAESFEDAWQKFVRQVEREPQRLLASTGSSQYRVSMAPRGGGVLGVNVNGNAELPYSANKASVEQVWNAIKPEVKASPSEVQDILKRGAHFGLIGAIVEEMRRLAKSA